MSPTAVVRDAWELYKAHWRTFVPIALVVYVLLGVLALVLTALLGVVGTVIAALVSIVGFFWLQGAYAEAVRDVRDGRQDLSIGQTFAAVQPRLPVLLAAGVLAVLGITVGLALLIVPGLFLLTIWALIIPAIVYEGKSVGESFGRSRELVRGNGWNVFGVIAITIGLAIVASIIIGIATIWLPDSVRTFVGDLISNTIVGPLVAVSWILMYFKLARPAEAGATAPGGYAAPPPSMEQTPPL